MRLRHWALWSPSKRGVGAQPLLGLADGIVTRTAQVERRPYAHTQVAHAFAWAFAVFGGGVVVDVFGMSGIFYALSGLKCLAALCLVAMAMRWPLHRTVDPSSAPNLCSVAAYVWSASQVKRLACLCALWGLCFVLVETFTIAQMDTELGFSKSASGFASMLAVLSGVPVYVRAPAVIASHGHRWLFAFGLCTATVFAAAHSFVHANTAALAVVVCPLRGVAYAAIWAALMDMLVRDVKNEFLASVQALVVLRGHARQWPRVPLLGARVRAAARPRCRARACLPSWGWCQARGPDRFPQPSSSSSAAVSWRVAHTIWLQAPGNHTLDSGQHARVLAGAIHTKLHDNAHTSGTQPRSNNNTLDAHTPVALGNSSHRVPHRPVLNAVQDTRIALHEYVQRRIAHTTRGNTHGLSPPRLNRWRKVARCGARVPAMLAFFDAGNVTLLADYKAPASGAVVKLNHMAGQVHVLAAGASLSASDVTRYTTLVQQSYRKQEPHYGFVRHGVIIEEFISAFKTSTPPDYKTYAFDGTIALVRIHFDRRCSVVRGTYACSSSYLYVDPTHAYTLPFSRGRVHRIQQNYPPMWLECYNAGKLYVFRYRLPAWTCTLSTAPFLGEFTMTPHGGGEEVTSGSAPGSFVHSEQLFRTARPLLA